VGEGVDGHGGQSGGERGEDHDQTHRLVHDHGLEGEEPEHPNQQRQPELGAAEADVPAKNADTGAGWRMRQIATWTGAAR